MTSHPKCSVERWQSGAPPNEEEVRRLLSKQGLSGYRWSNSPGDVYRAHHHPFHKVIYVLQGSITFTLPESGEQLILNSGDRLDLPKGIVHEAVVGPQGVICVESHQEA
ncbi:MAG: cupin domain-containing protein [Anaerolineales bacterium]|jgi:quercetin dioxygenase-like cupin family protein